MRLRGLYLVLCVGLWGCGSVVKRDVHARGEALPRRWHYDVTLDDELSRVDVRMCFEGAVARELRAGKDEAAPHLAYARWGSPGPVQRLRVANGRVQLERGAENACVEYRVSLDEHASMDATVQRVGRDLIASPNVWLWRPQKRALHATATLRLHLPKDVQASLPWPEQGGVYELDRSAFGFDSYSAFGRFRKLHVEHRGVALDVALLDGKLSIDEAATRRWLSRAIEVSSTMDGLFPTPRAQLIIAPAGALETPVLFGAVARGGMGSILLFVSSNASESELIEDWVLPHELSHLALPFVRREDAWLPEGLATYYQEVLRARAGVLSEQEALKGFVTALASARTQGTGRSLRDESAEMYRTYAFRSVYWGGAAYFLLADVALRAASDNRLSIDRVLTLLRKDPPSSDVMTAEELLAHMDRIAGVQILLPLAKEVLERPFPDTESTLRDLGIVASGREVELDDQARLVSIRQAIFGPRELSPVLGDSPHVRGAERTQL